MSRSRRADFTFDSVRAAGHDVRVFDLVCDEATIEARIDAKSRRTMGKLTELRLYRQLRDEGVFDVPVVRGVTVDATQPPADSAAQICRGLR